MNALAEGLLTLTFGGAGAILLYGGSREMLDASREFIALTVDPIFSVWMCRRVTAIL